MKTLRTLIPCLCAVLCLLAGRAFAETAVWSESFDINAASRWTIPKGWHINSPTAGPKTNAAGFRAFSGADCANTQNYAVNTDARLICTSYNGTNSLLIPSADQSPRLRFWHWFNIASAVGYVEISTDGGTTWNQISPGYNSITGGGVWSRPYVDLSAYAGQSVMFALHFYAPAAGNGLGWYVDDMEVVTSADPPTLTFPEGFESDPKTSDWFVDFGTWEIGKPTTGPGSAHSGANCAATVLNGNYAQHVDSRLISPAFTVPSSSPTLRYWQWYSFISALGYVEIFNGTNTSSTTTNITITTNITTTLDTNVYQLFGSTITNYSAPLYWNPAIGGYTNATKTLGSTYDSTLTAYLFEVGNTPLTSGGFNSDYRIPPGGPVPIPPTTTPTNFIILQGASWSPLIGTNSPIGYFGTNTTVTYTTNTTTVTTGGIWSQIGPTFGPGIAKSWVQQTLDLSAYAGQTVQLAFHFTSGAGTALGWYVDDLSMIAAPTLIVPTTNLVVNFGQQFTNILTATNPVEPASIFTFALAAPSSDVIIKANGVMIWTNTAAPPGTYEFVAKVTDNNSPPLSDTNTFSVTVLPLSSQLVLTNAALINNGTNGKSFKFSINTPWTNNPLLIMASTNLVSPTNWIPIYTNPATPGGTLQFTDQLSTNFLQRFYRAMFQ